MVIAQMNIFGGILCADLGKSLWGSSNGETDGELILGEFCVQIWVNLHGTLPMGK